MERWFLCEADVTLQFCCCSLPNTYAILIQCWAAMILEKDPTMVIFLNSCWSPGLHLMLYIYQPFWNKILQYFGFIGNLQTFLMPIWNYISSYWKCLQKGNPISQLAWDLTSPLLLLKFWADVAGGVMTTTILLDSSCFYCCPNYNLHWGFLTHRLQRLIQWRLRAEQIWPFLKFFARKKIVLQVLIWYWLFCLYRTSLKVNSTNKT